MCYLNRLWNTVRILCRSFLHGEGSVQTKWLRSAVRGRNILHRYNTFRQSRGCGPPTLIKPNQLWLTPHEQSFVSPVRIRNRLQNGYQTSLNLTPTSFLFYLQLYNVLYSETSEVSLFLWCLTSSYYVIESLRCTYTKMQFREMAIFCPFFIFLPFRRSLNYLIILVSAEPLFLSVFVC